MAPANDQAVADLPEEFRSVHHLGRLVRVYRKNTAEKIFSLALFAGYWILCALILPAIKLGKTFTGVDLFIIACFAGTGGYWGWRISAWWKKAIAIYEDGVAFADRRETRAYHWNEIAWLRCRHVVTTVNVVFRSRYRKYTLAPDRGEPFAVDSSITTDATLYDQLDERTFPHLWQRATALYEAGAWVDFGPIRINQALGLEIKGKRFEWQKLQGVTVRNGAVRVTPREGKLFGEVEVMASSVKNVAVLIGFLDQLLAPRAPSAR